MPSDSIYPPHPKNEVITVERASQTLTMITQQMAVAETIPDYLDTHKVADAFEAAMQKVKFGRDWQNRFFAVRMRAMREIGNLRIAMERNKGGRPSETRSHGEQVSQPPTIEELGMSRKFAADCNKLARWDKAEFEAYLRSGDGDETTNDDLPRLSRRQIIKLADAAEQTELWKKQREAERKRIEAEAAAKQQAQEAAAAKAAEDAKKENERQRIAAERIKAEQLAAAAEAAAREAAAAAEAAKVSEGAAAAEAAAAAEIATAEAERLAEAARVAAEAERLNREAAAATATAETVTEELEPAPEPDWPNPNVDPTIFETPEVNPNDAPAAPRVARRQTILSILRRAVEAVGNPDTEGEALASLSRLRQIDMRLEVFEV